MSRSETSRPETHRKDVDSNHFRLSAWMWKHQIGWLVTAGVVIALVLQFRTVEGDRQAAAQSNQAQAKPHASKASTKQASSNQLPRKQHPQHDVMALVNGKDISRPDLMDACIKRFGEDVLESLVNKRLIMSHCEKRKITVTQQEICLLYTSPSPRDS